MKNHINNQRGGAVIFEVILLVLVLAVAGYAVYNYYQSKKAVNPTIPPTPHHTASPSASPVASNVLLIPELGIQMTLPDGLSKSDVYYVAKNTPQTVQGANGKPYQDLADVMLSTHSLTAAEPGCAANKATDGTLSGMIGFEKTDVDVDSGYQIASRNTDSLKVGNFYTSVYDRQSYCSTSSPTMENSQYSLFLKAYSTIQPLN